MGGRCSSYIKTEVRDTEEEETHGDITRSGGNALGRGSGFIVQAHITGHSLSIRVLHKEHAFTDWQSDHLMHLPAQGVVNSYLELWQEGQSHNRPPNPSSGVSSHTVLALQDKPCPL